MQGHRRFAFAIADGSFLVSIGISIRNPDMPKDKRKRREIYFGHFYVSNILICQLFVGVDDDARLAFVEAETASLVHSVGIQELESQPWGLSFERIHPKLGRFYLAFWIVLLKNSDKALTLRSFMLTGFLPRELLSAVDSAYKAVATTRKYAMKNFLIPSIIYSLYDA